MKTKSKISGHIIRSGAAAVFFLFALVALSSAFNSNRAPKPAAATGSAASAVKAPNQARALSFAERVAYQRAIEEVNWRHRIWPKANAAPKPSLDKVMTQAQIAQKVEDYLRNSQALEDYWQKPITPDQLQAEMERIASHTKQPGMLREMFAALGDDPFVIAECLVRPVLAERLLTEVYAHDQRFHGELKRRAEAELRTYPSVRQMKQTSGKYTEVEWIKSDSGKTGSTPVDTKETEALNMSRSEWQESVEYLTKEFGFGPARHAAALESADMSAHSKNSAVDKYETLPIGKLSPMQEEDGHYYAVAVMKKGKDRVKLATIAWLKEPLQSWLAKAEAQVPMTMAAVSADYTLPVIAGPSGGCTDDTWTATSLTNAPAGRRWHTAVWTGSEMIVWGGLGSSGVLNTGGRYNPSTDSWTAISTTNAPSARSGHTAVWTGSEVIVWGGSDTNTGGRYSPSTDSWAATSTSNAPTARDSHTAVWTGSQMIVWGGFGQVNDFNTGGRYNPGTDTWTATSTINAPSARDGHTAIWADSEMIVWGGGINDFSNPYNTGGRYNPGTDSWTATSTTNAPAASSHTAVWTGSQMIVWGGCQAPDVFCGRGNAGGRYNPGTDSWAATSTTNAPSARNLHTAVWTGSEMIIWGGFSPYINSGGRYNPSTDSWTATSTANAPSARGTHTAVWTGSQTIVWGGYDGSNYLNTGGRYCAQSQAPAQLGNISTRAFVQTGDNVMIGGLIITGSGQKRVIVRAIGPSLVNQGITNPLQNPTLELHDHTGAVIASNDNWMDAPNKQEIIDSGLAPSNNLESAILMSLSPGNYTGILRGVNNGTGIALVEGYDLDPTAGSKLGNMSTRALVQTGDNVMIGGVIITGSGQKNVIVRAIGPSLAQYGITNPLLDPTLELHDGNGVVIAFDDNWKDSQQAEIEATGLAPSDDRESAIVRTLAPGNYTAIVRGKNDTIGVALVEVYGLQ
jgi:N-acetylneuraminic acid mutarotase